MALARISPEEIRSRSEQTTLQASLAALLALILSVSSISVGFVLVLIAASAVWVKARQAALLEQSIKISEAQLPEVHAAARDAAAQLGMGVPDVFVAQNPQIGAFALEFLRRKSVVLNSASVEAMEPDELRSMLGHEFTHLWCHHTRWMVFTNLDDTIRVPVISDLVGLIFLSWSRKAEYTADRGALLASGNLDASISAIAKIAVGRELSGRLDLDALSELHPEATWASSRIVQRIRALEAFAGSERYSQLASRSVSRVSVTRQEPSLQVSSLSEKRMSWMADQLRHADGLAVRMWAASFPAERAPAQARHEVAVMVMAMIAAQVPRLDFDWVVDFVAEQLDDPGLRERMREPDAREGLRPLLEGACAAARAPDAPRLARLVEGIFVRAAGGPASLDAQKRKALVECSASICADSLVSSVLAPP